MVSLILCLFSFSFLFLDVLSSNPPLPSVSFISPLPAFFLFFFGPSVLPLLEVSRIFFALGLFLSYGFFCDLPDTALPLYSFAATLLTLYELYITLHHTTLRYTTLHPTKLHCTALLRYTLMSFYSLYVSPFFGSIFELTSQMIVPSFSFASPH